MEKKVSLKSTILSTSRLNKKLITLAADFFSMCIATFFALLISDVSLVDLKIENLLGLLWLPCFTVVSFWYLGVYSSIVRYINFSVILIIARAILFVFIINLFFKFLYTNFLEYSDLPYSEALISFEGWLVGLFTFSFLVITSRITAYYYLSDTKFEKRVVIYGAGSAGIQLASALRVSKEIQPIAFIDQNPSLHGTYLGGIKILHPKKLQRLILKDKVDEVLIAIPSASKSNLRNLLKEIERYSIKVRILPGLAELAQGKVLVSELKEVDVMDLLGRSEVEA